MDARLRWAGAHNKDFHNREYSREYSFLLGLFKKKYACEWSWPSALQVNNRTKIYDILRGSRKNVFTVNDMIIGIAIA